MKYTSSDGNRFEKSATTVVDVRKALRLTESLAHVLARKAIFPYNRRVFQLLFARPRPCGCGVEKLNFTTIDVLIAFTSLVSHACLWQFVALTASSCSEIGLTLGAAMPSL